MNNEVTQHEDKSPEWLDWRQGGIGSSDAPIIMGVSPWCTAYELWEYKTKKKVREQSTNWAIDRGNRVEPVVRARYEMFKDMEMGAALCEHKDMRFMRASMDGWNPKAMVGLEIKVPGLKDHELARQGKLPEKYWPQVQHQLFVTGAARIDYVSYYLEKGQQDHQGEMIIVPVEADIPWLTEYVARASDFWKCVTDDVAPPFAERDFQHLTGDAVAAAAEQYKAALAAQKEAEQKVADARAELERLADGVPRAVFGETGLTVTTVYRQGNVNYKAIPELKGVNLDRYRGKSSSYRKVNVQKI